MTGLLSKLSEPSMGVLWVFLPLAFVFWDITFPVILWFVVLLLLLLLLLASSDDLLGCSLFGIVLVLLQGTETGSVLGLLLEVEGTCLCGIEEI
uniref:Uncharacterized protein n=1 Tax=Lotus japonicus TaxID=34305 RepID=I3SEB1_LOTJA|nr:unknown [Lotus japonicus]